MSSLKEDEEAKIKKILNLDQTLSTTAILNDVFQDDDYEDAASLERILTESKASTKPLAKPARPASAKSPNVSKKISTTHTPRKPLNKTYEKSLKASTITPSTMTPLIERKVSPIISVEREMEGRRELIKEHNSLQREEDAKRLLEDLLVENRHIQNEINRNASKSKSPVASSPSTLKRKSKTKSRSPQLKPPSRIPVASKCFFLIFNSKIYY